VEICEWCFRVVDHCNIDRDVVGIALSYFDRYLSSQTSTKQSLMKLVGMTSLYLAAKWHSTRKISVSNMSSLSHGHFQVDQILNMESCIIKALNFHLNPPTPFIYLNVACPLIGDSAEKEARYLIELSVCDDYFMDKKPSCVAYAAILVAMDLLAIPRKRFPGHGLKHSPIERELCIQRLHQLNSLTSPEMEEEGVSPSTRECPSPTTVI